MKYVYGVLLASVFIVAPATAGLAQTPAAAELTDVYHVHFTKAVPGQAAALAQDLQRPNPGTTMPGHLVMLRHQEGDDWDYCVIEHMGTTAVVKVTPPPAADAPALSMWHNDTFVAGPSWAEFSRLMGLPGAESPSATPVYVVAVHRAVPGHRQQLADLLNQPDPSKVPVSHLTMPHLEGGPWQFLSVDRYNSWQDLASARAAASSGTGGGPDRWAELRQHSAYHVDTIADRIAPR